MPLRAAPLSPSVKVSSCSCVTILRIIPRKTVRRAILISGSRKIHLTDVYISLASESSPVRNVSTPPPSAIAGIDGDEPTGNGDRIGWATNTNRGGFAVPPDT